MGIYQGLENSSENEEEVHPEAIPGLVHTDQDCFSPDHKIINPEMGILKFKYSETSIK